MELEPTERQKLYVPLTVNRGQHVRAISPSAPCERSLQASLQLPRPPPQGSLLGVEQHESREGSTFPLAAFRMT
jgi:hypothetical protein